MTGHEIRSLFLRFFEERGHRVVKSSPLLPANDPTLLFSNAGMNQFKDVFTGRERREYARAASSQKCVRAGGKHNDLDEVGKTARHHTFFEMLGNFSFGDYFKEEAIRFAWDLLVDEMKLDVDRLWFTVYEGDDKVPPDEEAERLWAEVGAPPERILRFGKDNFWQMGDTGPCGPCSEIHYFIGDDPSMNVPEYVNGPGDTIMEIWNLVFMQYERSADGTLAPLPAPSVDTGAGLERVAAVIQNVKSNYDTDLIRPIIDFAAGLSKKEYAYDSEHGVSMRVIADHARAATFLIADGIFPGNEGRAYVLRKIMRRALWHGRLLGMETPFFNQVCGFVVDHMKAAYPELESSRATIDRVVSTEERLFASTLSAGLRKLDEIIERTEGTTVKGEDLWYLYGTYGLREDLLRYALESRGLGFDEEGFAAARDAEAEENRRSWKGGGAGKEVKPVYRWLADRGFKTEFRGYDETATEGARVLALIRDDEHVEELASGQEGEVVLDRTPFYAESGGQVGDQGWIDSDRGRLIVADTRAAVHGVSVHRAMVEQGSVRVGDHVSARVDAEKRRRTRANHTATHLLHAALKDVVGPHVKQAGSLVAPDRLRFDFTHFAPLTQDEVLEIERQVNHQILRNQRLDVEERGLEEAISSGAVALFGEKYGDRVRIVSVPGVSTELCGGTHVRATGDIGLFKIVSDQSIASGVRRIEALTADGAFERYQLDEALLGSLAQQFRTSPQEVPSQVERLSAQLRLLEREVDTLRLKLASAQAGSAADEAREVSGVKVLARRIDGLDANGMRQMADQLSQKLRSGVVVLGAAGDGKASLVVRVTEDLTPRLQAGKLVNVIASKVGGKGGGRPDMATAGGREPEKLDAALESAYEAVAAMLE
jgi:alanyl-tRNA synthetase